MFAIGDKVVYPPHGAGVVLGIERKDVLGVERNYYVLHIPSSSMKVMVPCDNVAEIGLRNVIKPDDCEQVMAILGGENEKDLVVDDKWNKRCREHMDKIKSGNVYDLAGIVRSLSLRNQEKPLSNGEKRLLDQAKNILASELMLVYDSSLDGVVEKMENIMGIVRN